MTSRCATRCRRPGLALALVWATVVPSMAMVLSPTSARADDARPAQGPAPRDLVAALRPDEIRALRRHLPTWDTLSASERRRVAGVVLQLRSASPEARARILERLRLAAASGPTGLRDLRNKLDGFARLGGETGERFVRARAAVHVLAAAIVAALPSEGAPSVYEGLTLAERGQLDGAIAAHWKRRMVEAEMAALDLTRPTPAGTPAALRDDLESLRNRVRAEGGSKAPEPLRRQWAERWITAAVNQSVAGFVPTTPGAPGADPHVAVQGRRLRNLSPTVFDTVGADLVDARGRGRAGLETFIDRHRGERTGEGLRTTTLWRLLDTLEEKRPHLAGDVLARLDDLQLALLRTLQVPDDESAAFRAASFPDRMRHLTRLKEERGILSGRGPGGRVVPGQRPGGGGAGRRTPPAPPGDDHE